MSLTALDTALAAVAEDRYVREPDGRPLPQTSNPAIIAAMLRLLAVEPGARVLEIGTGSGYSTALLAYLVGPSGVVTSLEIDPQLAGRARRLLSQQRVPNAVVIAADGEAGSSTAAPFDRVIAWATADELPQAWVEQVEVGGLIVAPVQLAPLGYAIAVVRLRRDAETVVVGEQIISGSFVPLTRTPLFAWGEAPPQADLVLEPENDPATWISAEWLRGPDIEARSARLRPLCTVLSSRPSPVSPEEMEAFRAYLLASLPRGLTTAFTQPIGHAIGFSNSDSVALLSLRDGALFEAGDGTARAELICWIEKWRAGGSPGFEQMLPILEQTTKGWIVRATLKQP